MSKQQYMVFDVESIGLHGEAFAVGWVVVDAKGVELSGGIFGCPPDNAQGQLEARAWVMANCPRLPITHATPREVRDAFWAVWADHQTRARTILVADCPWPVEARFLTACVHDDLSRCVEAPYPLLDVASVRAAVGLDPFGAETRTSAELPVHDPHKDARQSARLFHEALARYLRVAPTEEAADDPWHRAMRDVSGPSWRLFWEAADARRAREVENIAATAGGDRLAAIPPEVCDAWDWQVLGGLYRRREATRDHFTTRDPWAGVYETTLDLIASLYAARAPRWLRTSAILLAKVIRRLWR